MNLHLLTSHAHLLACGEDIAKSDIRMARKARTKANLTRESQTRAEFDDVAAALLNEALGREDGAAFLEALNLIVRANGFAAIARRTKLNRTWLYKAISSSGNVSVRTLISLLAALGLRLSVERPRKRSIGTTID